MGEIVCRVRGYSFSDRVQSVTRDEAMSGAAFKFASPPDISMKGCLFMQLLQVRPSFYTHMLSMPLNMRLRHAARHVVTALLTAKTAGADEFQRWMRFAAA
jgi:hypothetical protein